MFVNVALNIPGNKLFTYEVPEHLADYIQKGKRVFVPFGRRKRTGFIISSTNTCEEVANVKPIFDILDDEPLFGDEDLEFYRKIADYFMYPLGKTLAELIPSGAEKKDFLWVSAAALSPEVELSPAQDKIISFLRQYPHGISWNKLTKSNVVKNIAQSLYSMHAKGLIEITEKNKSLIAPRTKKIITVNKDFSSHAKLTEKQAKLLEFMVGRNNIALPDLIREAGVSMSVIKNMEKKGAVTITEEEDIRRVSLESVINTRENEKIQLNIEQKKALEIINVHCDKNTFTPILLHGVTGSGKTEVYLNAIEKVILSGATAIYLVPEISLTPQLISRIKNRFPQDKVAVLHSRIAETIRYDQWRQIRRGDISLVIGARSALFAPLPNLKLIVVDEEHDSSYKQDDRLNYHARDFAVVKAKMNSAVVILGSATPSVRSFFNARTKKYQYIELSCRVDDKPLPNVEIIDMKQQKEMLGKAPLLSDRLICAITDTLNKKEQILLFLNRRGFDTFLVCADCGYNFRCPNCSVSLKNHPAQNIIKCHYCDYNQKSLPVCPSCKNSRILSYGTGTQKLEKEIADVFPAARLARMDSDTMQREGSYDNILQSLDNRNIDILIGTQMVTKGHDFPHITLVGVICADTSLNMPDFRAAEKTFQILTQVAGRCGRGSSPGTVIIQTFDPDNYALRQVLCHDYKSFYEKEVSFREALNYPPFSQIINVRLSSVRKNILADYAQETGKKAQEINRAMGEKAQIIGPAEAPLSKLRGRFRRQMLIKGENIYVLHQIARKLMNEHKLSAVKMEMDVDPDNFM
ncbi:MAG TPA: primosomal protein N' [Deltaproteobacteria bacterium]|nr:primosomal protein N' [Deltaproteobacteria bacterium]